MTIYCQPVLFLFLKPSTCCRNTNSDDNFKNRCYYLTIICFKLRKRPISVRFLGIMLRVLRLEVIVYNVYITNQFQTTSFAGGGGGGDEVKSFVEVTVNSKEERPRIRHQYSIGEYWEVRFENLNSRSNQSIYTMLFVVLILTLISRIVKIQNSDPLTAKQPFLYSHI